MPTISRNNLFCLCSWSGPLHRSKPSRLIPRERPLAAALRSCFFAMFDERADWPNKGTEDMLTSVQNPIHHSDSAGLAVVMLAVLVIVQLFLLVPCSGNLPTHYPKQHAAATDNRCADRAGTAEKDDIGAEG